MKNWICVSIRHDLPPHRLDAKIMAAYRDLRDMVRERAADQKRASLLGKPKSPEHVAKLIAARRARPGAPCTQEAKAKIGAAHKGRRKSPAWRAKISKSMQAHFAGTGAQE